MGSHAATQIALQSMETVDGIELKLRPDPGEKHLANHIASYPLLLLCLHQGPLFDQENSSSRKAIQHSSWHQREQIYYPKNVSW